MINTIIHKEIQSNKECVAVFTCLGQKDTRGSYQRKLKQTTLLRLPS